MVLLGGLAFHTRLQKDGLLFTILHEIGHHVARASDHSAQSSELWIVRRIAGRLRRVSAFFQHTA